MEILIVQTAFLGDLLLSIPLIRGASRCFPDSKITLVCRQGLSNLIEPLNLVDTVLEVKKNDKISYQNLQKSLKQKKWDYVFCPHESFRSALLVNSLNAKTKVGFKKWWNAFIFNQRVPREMRLPDALRQASLLNPVCQKQQELFLDFTQSRDAWNPVERDKAVEFSSMELPDWASMKIEPGASLKPSFVVRPKSAFIFPGSVWATKRWTEEGFVGVAKELVADGYYVYWMGSPDEASLCEKLAEQVEESESLAGKVSLLDSYLALTQGEVLISNDSGSMHMGSMAGIPTLAIFGPTVLDIGYRPWQKRAIVVQKSLECRPCGLHGHQRCPLGHHRCMREISAAEVSLHRKTLLR